MGSALSGVDKKYRTDDGYVRWGLVEKDIHEAIDKASQPAVEPDGEKRAG